MSNINTFDPTTFDPTEIKAAFDRDGFVIFPDFLDQEQLDDLNGRIGNHFRPIIEKHEELKNRHETLDKFECDVTAWAPVQQGESAFIELMKDPSLDAITKACIGEGYEDGRSLVMWSVAGGKGQSWHQDCPPGDLVQANTNRLFYMRDSNVEDGAIVVVPGSHTMGRIPPGGHQDPIEGEVFLTPKAGTLVMLHGHVYHRVTPNVSRKPRVSVNFRAFPKGVSWEVCSIGVYRNGAINFKTKEAVEIK